MTARPAVGAPVVGALVRLGGACAAATAMCAVALRWAGLDTGPLPVVDRVVAPQPPATGAPCGVGSRGDACGVRRGVASPRPP